MEGKKKWLGAIAGATLGLFGADKMHDAFTPKPTTHEGVKKSSPAETEESNPEVDQALEMYVEAAKNKFPAEAEAMIADLKSLLASKNPEGESKSNEDKLFIINDRFQKQIDNEVK